MANPMDCSSPAVVVQPTGDVMWVLPCHFSTMCDDDMNSLEKARSGIHCNLEVGSWTLDSSAMNLLVADEVCFQHLNEIHNEYTL